jgi:hypothetical protein
MRLEHGGAVAKDRHAAMAGGDAVAQMREDASGQPQRVDPGALGAARGCRG